MKTEDRFYSATDVAHSLVGGELPAKAQYDFLAFLRDWEWIFLPPEWRGGDDGFRAMLLDVQNAISYLVDKGSFDVERKAVEDEGGALPSLDAASGAWQFLKTLRIEIVFAEFLEKPGFVQKRMKCRTILKRCGYQRRSEAFCREFELAANFYHIGLRHAGKEAVTFSIDEFSVDENLFLMRL